MLLMANSFLRASLVLAMCLMVQNVSSDISGDKAQCSEQLAGLATCLTYVEGTAKAPTPDCCSGLKEVLAKSPKCLCILVKDHDDPQLGIQVNVTLALSLPAACSNPVNISKCSKLLNLPPNSKDAAIFKQSGNGTTTSQAKGNSAANASAVASTSQSQRSGARSYSLAWKKGRWWVGAVEMVFSCVVSLVVPPLLVFFT